MAGNRSVANGCGGEPKGMIDIRKHRPRDELFDSMPPLRWQAGGAEGAAFMTCSRGHQISFVGHIIGAMGSVHPAIKCPVMGCGFHDYVRLVGWVGGGE